MPYCTLEEIYKSPWGIIEHRRAEVESGKFGIFDKIMEEEINNQFLHCDGIAALMEVHPHTAKKWLDDADARFIIHGQRKLFMKEDAFAVAEKRKQKKLAIKEKKEKRDANKSKSAA